MQTLIRTLYGSHLYGTETPGSDRDWKAVFVPSKTEILLGNYQDAFERNSKPKGGAASAKNTPDDVDIGYTSVRRFVAQIGQGEVNALDTLFAVPLVVNGTLDGDVSKLGEELYENRHRLLCRQSAAYVGYCRNQANKYGVKGSRAAAAEKVFNFFYVMRRDLGGTVKCSAVRSAWVHEIEGAEHCEIIPIDGPSGPIDHFSCCGRKVPFTASLTTAVDIYSILWQGYGARALDARDNKNVDWKAMSHAVRVGFQAIELLSKAHITFPRPEAKYLTEIKTGQQPFDLVAKVLDNLLHEVEEAAASSFLPEKPDLEWADDFVCRVHMDAITKE